MFEGIKMAVASVTGTDNTYAETLVSAVTSAVKPGTESRCYGSGDSGVVKERTSG
jgi:hypothetical protein